MSGIPDLDLIWNAVGEAITNWSRIEKGLFQIFFQSLSAPAFGPPSAAFVAADSFRAKLNMVHSTLHSITLAPPLMDKWGKLHERCQGAARERNRLAHSQGQLLQVGHKPARAVLAPYEHDVRFWTNEGHLDQRRVLGINRVKTINAQFCRLGSDLERFSRKIHRRPKHAK